MNVSRFANPNRTDVLPLGPCQCPDRRKAQVARPGADRRVADRGTPHEQDEAVYRLELGANEEERAGTYGWSITGWTYFDSAAARAKLVEIGVVRWNLLGPDGQEMPVNARSASLLDAETLQLITNKLDEVTAKDERKDDPLPNASGARSGGSSPASASRARTKKKTR